MVHPETNSLLVLYDDAQSINRRKARLGFSFAEVGIQARGRTTILRMNYRNTAQIMAVACEFARDLLSAKEAEEDAIPLVAPQSAGRRGALPELRSFAGEEAELAYVVERARALHKGGTAWKDMAILFRYNKQGERFAETLSRAGVPYDLLAATGSLANESVKILSMHSSKGFKDSMPAPSQEVAAEAKLLYVAMTRALERLHMTHHGRSVFVDRVRAAVARVATSDYEESTRERVPALKAEETTGLPRDFTPIRTYGTCGHGHRQAPNRSGMGGAGVVRARAGRTACERSGAAGGLQCECKSAARRDRLFRPPATRQAMKMHYDEKVDALYLTLDDSEVVESEEVKPGIVLDFNAENQVVGIEVLDLRKRVPSANLKEMQFDVA